MSPRPADVSWRDGREPELIWAIEAAIDQYRANMDYETNSPTVAATVDQLQELSIHCAKSAAVIKHLSVIGTAAVYDVGGRRGIELVRYELTGRGMTLDHIAEAGPDLSPIAAAASGRKLSGIELGRHALSHLGKTLEQLSEIAGGAAETLRGKHSPSPDSGQGSGSATGRDSDLRAVKSDLGGFTDRVFQSPRDKLGVAVIKALFYHDRKFDSRARGSAAALKSFLNKVWAELTPNGSTNWGPVVRARHEISAWVDRKLESEARRKSVIAKRNITSRKKQKMPN